MLSRSNPGLHTWLLGSWPSRHAGAQSCDSQGPHSKLRAPRPCLRPQPSIRQTPKLCLSLSYTGGVPEGSTSRHKVRSPDYPHRLDLARKPEACVEQGPGTQSWALSRWGSCCQGARATDLSGKCHSSFRARLGSVKNMELPQKATGTSKTDASGKGSTLKTQGAQNVTRSQPSLGVLKVKGLFFDPTLNLNHSCTQLAPSANYVPGTFQALGCRVNKINRAKSIALIPNSDRLH